MKRFLLSLLVLVCSLHAEAFDWKSQSNEELRNDMFRFVETFRSGTSDVALAEALDGFLKVQMGKAEDFPYQWIHDTHAFVDEMLLEYPAEISSGGQCSYERRSLLLLRDYPMHADNRSPEASQGLKDAYVSSVSSLYKAAEQDALEWLRSDKRSRKLDVFKVYNMGYLFRSSGKVVGFDIQWSGNKEEMKDFAAMVDAFFVTHPHRDHYTKELLHVLLEAGKDVILPCDLVPEYTGKNKIIISGDVDQPMNAGPVTFTSRMGNQGVKVPCNVYLVSVGKWNIAHNGDNGVPECESFLGESRVDVLVSACWNGVKDTMNHIKRNPEGTECIYFSSHENEWRHTVDHRESYEELFRRTDRLGDPDYDYLQSVVMDAAGDMMTLK